MCIALCFKHIYISSYHICSLFDCDLIWWLSESYTDCQIRRMPFIDPFMLQVWVSLHTMLKTAKFNSHK